jgi:general secretion pathway protein H
MRSRRRFAFRSRAFTLLEMLVVIVLIALLTSVVTISTRPDPHRALALQAQRIGLLMGIASDDVRMRQQPIYWEADLHGYRFMRENGGERSTIVGDDLLRERAWDPPLTRLAVIDLASGTTRTLVNAQAPALSVPAAKEWVQPRWRLELANEQTSVAIEFDANGHADLVN